MDAKLDEFLLHIIEAAADNDCLHSGEVEFSFPDRHKRKQYCEQLELDGYIDNVEYLGQSKITCTITDKAMMYYIRKKDTLRKQ